MALYETLETKRVLHLEFEGTEGQITTVDSSEYGHAITRTGDAQITLLEHDVGNSSAIIKSTPYIKQPSTITGVTINSINTTNQITLRHFYYTKDIVLDLQMEDTFADLSYGILPYTSDYVEEYTSSDFDHTFKKFGTSSFKGHGVVETCGYYGFVPLDKNFTIHHWFSYDGVNWILSTSSYFRTTGGWNTYIFIDGILQFGYPLFVPEGSGYYGRYDIGLGGTDWHDSIQIIMDLTYTSDFSVPTAPFTANSITPKHYLQINDGALVEITGDGDFTISDYYSGHEINVTVDISEMPTSDYQINTVGWMQQASLWSVASHPCFDFTKNDFKIQCSPKLQNDKIAGIYRVSFSTFNMWEIVVERGSSSCAVYFLCYAMGSPVAAYLWQFEDNSDFSKIIVERKGNELTCTLDDTEPNNTTINTPIEYKDIPSIDGPILIGMVDEGTSYFDEIIIDTTTNESDFLTISDDATYVLTQAPEQAEPVDIDDDVTYKVQTDGVWYLEETLTDPLDSADSNTSLNTMASENDESLVLTDSHIIGWPMEATDALNIADEEAILNWLKTISESLALTDVGSMTWLLSISEILFIYDTLQHGWSVTNDESLVLTDSLSEVLGLMISDWITLTDTQTNNWNGRDIINDALNLYDVAQGVKRFSDTISESLGITDAASYALTVTVLEYLGFTSLAAAMKTMASTVNESIVLTDSEEHAWAKLITDTLSVVDTNSVITTFIGVISEALGISDAASPIKRIGASVDESLVFTETVTSQGTLYNAVYDTLKMSVTVEIDGEVYECYALNTPKFMPSMYSGFNFNSYCVFENRAFGANDTGIYELTGDTDAGSTIHDGAILSSTDFGSRNQKKFRRAYLGISGSSPVMVVETEEGERRVYNIDTKGKTVISHELKSKKWKLSIADFDDLDTMKLIPVILSK